MVVEFVFEAAVHGEIDHFTRIILEIYELFSIATHGKDTVFISIGKDCA